MKYAWIKANTKHFAVAQMCRVITVSLSGYYESLKRSPSQQMLRRKSIAHAAAHSYFESHRIYGYRKVHDDLMEENINCCTETVQTYNA